MSSHSQKAEVVAALMAALDRRDFRFAANQFSGTDLNRHLIRVPAEVQNAMTVIEEAEESWTGAFVREGSIELAKRALNVGFLPIGEVASLFSTHKVDAVLLEEIFALLSEISLFTCIKYTLKVPELVSCVIADDVTVSDCRYFANLIQQINLQMLTRTAGTVLGQRLSIILSYAVFMFFEQSNLSSIPAITTTCRHWKLLTPQKTVALCVDVPNGKIHSYTNKNFLDNRKLANEIFT